MPVTIYGDLPELEAFIHAIDDLPYRNKVVHNIMQAFCAEVVRGAAKKVRRRTAHTAQSISFRAWEMPLMAIIGVYNLVGAYLEKGTAAHQITASHASALMLPVHAQAAGREAAGGSPFGRTYGRRGSSRLTGSVRSGQAAFYRSVNHPGNRPMPFLMPAFTESLPVLDLLLLKAGAQIVHRMAARGELAGL